MTLNEILQLAGNGTAIAICCYMLNYFMRRDEVREKDIREIITNNTKAVEQASKAVDHNTEVINELKNSITDKIAVFEGLKDLVQKHRSVNGSR